mmetsp:Transcript_68548/g.200527  ORF Transcript_68548/g.200527 Transcript_68548/m.200527 type:complete len:802 (+) Transcript_68548:78-2483(+)
MPIIKAFQPRKERRLGCNVGQTPANENWITNGRVGDCDLFPWLRAVQRQGLELVIIGATTDACKVCIDAWFAGFKPVLIIMEDRVHDPRVHTMVHVMSHWCWTRGDFRNGPVIIYSDSSSCMVRLDEVGHVADTYVRTNAGGVFTCSESWSFFRGTAIVVDPFMTTDEEEAKLKKKERRVHFQFQPDEAPEALVSSTLCHFDGDSSGVLSSGVLTSGIKGSRKTIQSHMAVAGTGRGTVRPTSMRRKSARPSTVAEKEEMRTLRNLFLDRIAEERPVVTDSQFWEHRYDPERFSFHLMSWTEMVAMGVFGAAYMILFLLESERVHFDNFPLWRILMECFFVICFVNASVSFFGGALGIISRRDRISKMALLVGLVHVAVYFPMAYFKFGDAYYLTTSSASLISLGATQLVIPVAARCWKLTITRAGLCWYLSVAFGISVPWLVSGAVVIMFLRLLPVNGYLAAVLMTLTFEVLEHIGVHTMSQLYNAFVWIPRQTHPNAILGDQKEALSACIIFVRGCVEVGRLGCLICAAVRGSSLDVLSQGLVCLTLNFLLNVAVRSHWLLCAGSRVIRSKWRTLLCPSAVSIFHQDCRYAVGWVRFFLLAGIMVGRYVVHERLDVYWIGQEPGVWCWNGVAFLMVLMCIFFELLESVIVVYLQTAHPAPVWEVLGDVMMERFNEDDTHDLCHPIHYMLRCSPGGFGRQDAATCAGKDILRTKTRVHLGGQDGQDLEARIVSSPNLKCTKCLAFWNLLFVVGAWACIFHTIMPAGLGMGNYHGRCLPATTSNVAMVFQRVVLFSTECEP